VSTEVGPKIQCWIGISDQCENLQAVSTPLTPPALGRGEPKSSSRDEKASSLYSVILNRSLGRGQAKVYCDRGHHFYGLSIQKCWLITPVLDGLYGGID